MAAPANMNPPGNRRIYMKNIDFLTTKARVEYIMPLTVCPTLRATLRDTLKDTFSNNRDIYLEMPLMYMGYLEIPLGKQRHFKRYLEKHSEH